MTLGVNLIGTAGALQSVTTLTITDADTPGGAGLFIVKGPYGAYFASNLGGGANVNEELADGEEFTIVHNADPATNLGGVQVYADESETATDGLLIANLGDGFDAHVHLHSGRTLKITADASASSNGVAINAKYDEAAGGRLRATTAGNANVTAKTSSVYSLVKAIS